MTTFNVVTLEFSKLNEVLHACDPADALIYQRFTRHPQCCYGPPSSLEAHVVVYVTIDPPTEADFQACVSRHADKWLKRAIARLLIACVNPGM